LIRKFNVNLGNPAPAATLGVRHKLKNNETTLFTFSRSADIGKSTESRIIDFG